MSLTKEIELLTFVTNIIAKKNDKKQKAPLFEIWARPLHNKSVKVNGEQIEKNISFFIPTVYISINE